MFIHISHVLRVFPRLYCFGFANKIQTGNELLNRHRHCPNLRTCLTLQNGCRGFPKTGNVISQIRILEHMSTNDIKRKHITQTKNKPKCNQQQCAIYNNNNALNENNFIYGDGATKLNLYINNPPRGIEADFFNFVQVRRMQLGSLRVVAA